VKFQPTYLLRGEAWLHPTGKKPWHLAWWVAVAAGRAQAEQLAMSLAAEPIRQIFSHGDPLRAMVTYYLGLPLDLLLRPEVSPASVTVLSETDSGNRAAAPC
jgi:broad specificity phosphatase PhoE